MTLLEAMNDGALFGRWFTGDSWASWRTFIKALFALPMDDADLSIYTQCTNRAEPPAQPASEAWCIAGRRSGKSFVMSLVAVYLSCFRDYKSYLAPGERITIMCIAGDRRQARTVFRYIKGLLSGVPLLESMIERVTAETIDLNNRVTIEVHVNRHTSVRGYSVGAVLADEISFWPQDDAASSDEETLAALRPAMSTVPGSMLLCLSSPYSRRGAMWTAWKRHYGKPGDVLIWQAPSVLMNPCIPQSIIDAAMAEDPARASSEYFAQFRTDLEAFISKEVVESSVIPDRHELPWTVNTLYKAFCDPSGGSSDSFTLAISHAEGDRMILDCVREVRPPFSPAQICSEFSETLRAYGLNEVHGDRYSGGWVVEGFQKYGVAYRVSEKSKSDLYLELLPLLNSGRVELLDHPKLVAQLANLERRTARSGKDSVDHGPGGHDDIINSAAGSLVGARAPVNFDDDAYDLGIPPTDFTHLSLTEGEPYGGFFE